MPIHLTLPPGPAALIQRLEDMGWEAYAVGGCVRDSLLGKIPLDWDLCTGATPKEMMECFHDLRVIPTGVDHGTVTVVLDGVGYEVTTFRTEEGYTDRRHPDRIRFVPSVEADLARRDFTINAMAYHPKRGLCDPFGGQADLTRRVLRCVGEPRERFGEDALRILRALRFASCLNFQIDPPTAQAALSMAEGLQVLPGERISTELRKLLCGEGVQGILLQFWPIFCQIIPELSPLRGFEQNTPYHCYTLERHTAEAVAAAPKKEPVRLCMLLHDIAKPLCRTTDVKEIAHYHGHPDLSAQMAEGILRRLRFDRATTERVSLLIRHHDERFSPDSVSIKRMLNRLGKDAFEQLLAVQRADTLAKGEAFGAAEAHARLDKAERELKRIFEAGECYSMADLAVTGSDLLALGIPKGKKIGLLLEQLLSAVIEGRLPNEKEVLLAALQGDKDHETI